ncbi:MAG TPA: type II CAAX endopeptidase family protein, partial [Gemmatimonadales bacterium]
MIGRARALGWSFVFLAGGFALTLFLVRLLTPGSRLADPGEALWYAGWQALVMLGAFGAATWLIGRRVLRFTAGDFGLVPVSRGVRGFGWGLLLGAVLAAVAMSFAVALGRAAWRDDGGATASWLVTVLATGLVLLPAALAEELIFRGVPMLALARAFGRMPAIIGLAILFGVGHANNPGITPLAIANITLAGVFLGLAFFSPGGLWTATGAHLGWNLALAGLAAPVSGLPLPMPWLDYVPRG